MDLLDLWTETHGLVGSKFILDVEGKENPTHHGRSKTDVITSTKWLVFWNLSVSWCKCCYPFSPHDKTLTELIIAQQRWFQRQGKYSKLVFISSGGQWRFTNPSTESDVCQSEEVTQIKARHALPLRALSPSLITWVIVCASEPGTHNVISPSCFSPSSLLWHTQGYYFLHWSLWWRSENGMHTVSPWGRK